MSPWMSWSILLILFAMVGFIIWALGDPNRKG